MYEYADNLIPSDERIQILQESCKKNSILARILQEKFNSCKNLARRIQFLQESCKKNGRTMHYLARFLARFLQDFEFFDH